MMYGNNSIALNQATMIRIVQYYLENVMFREGICPHVEKVYLDNNPIYPNKGLNSVDHFKIDVKSDIEPNNSK